MIVLYYMLRRAKLTWLDAAAVGFGVERVDCPYERRHGRRSRRWWCKAAPYRQSVLEHRDGASRLSSSDATLRPIFLRLEPAQENEWRRNFNFFVFFSSKLWKCFNPDVIALLFLLCFSFQLLPPSFWNSFPSFSAVTFSGSVTHLNFHYELEKVNICRTW